MMLPWSTRDSSLSIRASAGVWGTSFEEHDAITVADATIRIAFKFIVNII
jgi:hypothetical protein